MLKSVSTCPILGLLNQRTIFREIHTGERVPLKRCNKWEELCEIHNVTNKTNCGLHLSNNIGNFCKKANRAVYLGGNINHSHSSDKVRKWCPDWTSGDKTSKDIGTVQDKTSVGTKHLEGKNVRRDKMFRRQNACGDKTSGDKMSGGTKRPEGQNILLSYI